MLSVGPASVEAKRRELGLIILVYEVPPRVVTSLVRPVVTGRSGHIQGRPRREKNTVSETFQSLSF